MSANLHQSRTLATLRDPDTSGLPKLLSGANPESRLEAAR